MTQVAFGDISTFAGTTAALTGSHTVAAGERLVVGVLLEVVDAGKDVSGITFNGDALTFYNELGPSHGKLKLEVWYLLAPDVTTGDVVVSIEGGSSQKMGVVCLAVQNGHGTTLLSQFVEISATSDSANVSFSPDKDADDLYIAFAGHLQGADGFTLSIGETEHADFAVEGSFRMWCASNTTTEAGAELRWTQAQSKECSTVGFIIEAAAAGAVELAPKRTILSQAVMRSALH